MGMITAAGIFVVPGGLTRAIVGVEMGDGKSVESSDLALRKVCFSDVSRKEPASLWSVSADDEDILARAPEERCKLLEG